MDVCFHEIARVLPNLLEDLPLFDEQPTIHAMICNTALWLAQTSKAEP